MGDLNTSTVSHGENMMHAVLLKYGMRMATRLCREAPGGETYAARQGIVMGNVPKQEKPKAQKVAGQGEHVALAYKNSVNAKVDFTTLWHSWFEGLHPDEMRSTQRTSRVRRGAVRCSGPVLTT